MTSTWVLTAGHCCDKTFANEHSILAGLTKYRSNEQWSLVRKLFVHPHFNLDPMRNDICLMQVKQRQSLTCLPPVLNFNDNFSYIPKLMKPLQSDT